MTQRSDKEYRQNITQYGLNEAEREVSKKLEQRLEEKGCGAWLSRHEISGILTEEYHEVVEAIHSQSLDEVKEELKDIAVGCLFAIACINADTLDW